MKYFGIPTCPYCKKRVNLIRTWSLKRQGEYQCPRCNGISNIYLSPLIYVLGLLAVFSGGSLYFFHKFVLNEVTLETALYVFIPFAAFFLFSLFMVYLEKPVIKKISREEYEKKRRFRSAVENSPTNTQHDDQEYYDPEDYIPRGAYTPGPQQQDGEFGPSGSPSGLVNQAAFIRARQQAAMENVQVSQRVMVQKQEPSAGSSHNAQHTQHIQPAQHVQPAQPAHRTQGTPQAVQQRQRNQVAAPAQRPAIEPVPRRAVGQQSISRQQAQQRTTPTASAQQRVSFSQQGAAVQQRTSSVNNAQPRQAPRVVGSVGTPASNSSAGYTPRRMNDDGRGQSQR